MPKKSKALSAKQVEHLRTPGLHNVGGADGLYLKVSDTGARSWVFRYATPEVRISKTGKPFRARRDLGLGGYPEIGLAEARQAAREYRHRIKNYGEDPAEQRRAAQREWAESLRKNVSFEQAARQAFAKKAPEFRSKKHRDQWISRLEHYAFPKIGQLPVSEIDVNHVLDVLRPIWHTKTETATRVRQRIESVLTWAKVSGLREGDNPAEWRGNLKELLPDPNKLRRAQHFPALPYKRLPDFFKAVRAREGFSARALELVILTAARSGEVRGATWDEMDLKAGTWKIPADRMKNGKAHTVPLTKTAVEMLKALPRLEGNNYVFPAVRGGQMSDMSLTQLVRRMNTDNEKPWIDPATGRNITVHGLRSTFKDWCRERTRYPDEVSELQLAHINDDKTRAAYARSELIDKRRLMMADWEQFCVHGDGEKETGNAMLTELGGKA